MIDLARVREVLADIATLVEDLDGLDHEDDEAVTSQSKGKARQIRAQRAQDLQLLATRFELGASLTRIEYWYARGEPVPLWPGRDDSSVPHRRRRLIGEV